MSSKEYEKSYQLPWNILNVLLQPAGEKIGYVSQFEFAAVCCSRPMQNILTCRFAELIAQAGNNCCLSSIFQQLVALVCLWFGADAVSA
ncbi:hypothetical protein DAPPUDRAFT_316961 [Daphnia pulex]|uniref:Uncharacterized protein n=1 Tax=Daphnia pulex TaxID=6669 RepID=E9GEH5_DAPPU|nr:hypothetical protein DAPPUDRAFT_316961 [Daphnia pulex]|eukprot:EFX82267.1 hypothetical protein DAPPUDRAFT_316961 [Daphnia pulex]